MYENRERKERISNVVGILCGLFLVCVLVFSIVSAHTVPTVGLSSGEIPAGAKAVQGTAEGRNGPVTVEVTADNENIYQIRVLSEEETDGIGSVAVKQLPRAIYDGQDLNADECILSAKKTDLLPLSLKIQNWCILNTTEMKAKELKVYLPTV